MCLQLLEESGPSLLQGGNAGERASINIIGEAESSVAAV